MRGFRILSRVFLLPVLVLFSCSAGKTPNQASAVTKETEKVSLPMSEGIEEDNKRFESLGYQKGEKVPDITLFSSNGDKFILSETLKTGKPLMLISGSYTCDVSRSNLPNVDALTKKYGDKLNIYLVYTIDAHPSDVVSPYSPKNEIWVPRTNIRDKVKADQPKTYGERKALAAKWQQQYSIAAPVLVDSPANQFWLNYGQAPNMVYLLEPSGVVYYKQVWFKKDGLDKAISELIN